MTISLLFCVSFLDTNFGNSDGEMYKPDMGVGASLDYISDDTNYTALINENSDDFSNETVIELMERIESGEDLEEVFNIESYLKYLAVSTYTVNLDSYQGGLYDNYYLYNDNGVFQWIVWDINMAHNGFPGVQLSDSEAVQYLIDEYVANDTNSFYSYTEFENAVLTSSTTSYSILQFVEERSINVKAQLSGEIPSTNNGFGNVVDGQNPNQPPRR